MRRAGCGGGGDTEGLWIGAVESAMPSFVDAFLWLLPKFGLVGLGFRVFGASPVPHSQVS
eukprot:7586751-Pyramimonas_sp.AAC.3